MGTLSTINYLSSGVATGKSYAAAQFLKSQKRESNLTVIVVPTLAMIKQWKNEFPDNTTTTVVCSDDEISTLTLTNVDASVSALFKGKNVVQKLSTVLENTDLRGQKMVVITTQATFLTYSPKDKFLDQWDVIFDECPAVYSTVRIHTRDVTGDVWLKEMVNYSPTKHIVKNTDGEEEEKDGMFKMTLKPGNEMRIRADIIIRGRHAEDSRKRKVLSPLLNGDYYDVFSRHTGYTPHLVSDPTTLDKSATNKELVLECFSRISPRFVSAWKSVTILAADLMEKEFYLHFKNHFAFEEHAEMKALQDESRLNRDYSNVEIHFLSNKDQSLSKSDFKKDPTLIEKINKAVKEIVGDDDFIYTQNNSSAFQLDLSKYSSSQPRKVSSSSHGLNEPEWTACKTAVFMSALNDSAVSAKVKKELITMDNVQLRDALVSSSAYQTLGRCAIRTDDYHSAPIKLIVFDEYQAHFIQTKFKNSKVMQPKNGIIVSHTLMDTDQVNRRQQIAQRIKEEQFVIAKLTVKKKFGLTLNKENFMKIRKTKSEYKSKEILTRHVNTKEIVNVMSIGRGSVQSKATEYFLKYPHEFVDCTNIIV
jgi:hypothetical protein